LTGFGSLRFSTADKTFGTDFSGHELVDVAPNPTFAGLDGAHQRMLTFVKMLGRVFVPRRITTTNTSALQTQSQVDPSVTHFDAFFADVFLRAGDLDLFEMSARSGHRFPLN
jgi:hypothetical protein